jgi:hypothetical protein
MSIWDVLKPASWYVDLGCPNTFNLILPQISRIAKYSYGILVYRAFQKGDPEDKKVNEEGKLWCKNSFKTLYTINQEVAINGGDL